MPRWFPSLIRSSHAISGAKVLLLLAPLFWAMLAREAWISHSHPIAGVFDPSWSYLSNSLLIAQGHPPY